MNKTKQTLKMTVLAMLIALGVVISPFLRVEGMCPMAHFINIVCSVLMGPWYSLLCATLIGIIRMLTMGIPPIALTGAVFGAFLSGVFYRASKGNILFAVVGEVIGTGIIGAVASYPVMSILWGKEGLGWMFYVPSFICGTLIGGSIALVFLKKLSANGMLKKFQLMLTDKSFDDRTGIISNTACIAAVGAILYVVIEIPTGIFNLSSPVWHYVSKGCIAVSVVAAAVYFVMNKFKKADENEC
ncbi:MAG: energy coupling factor transporter S component ThiW [Oscillospiraceae bacterium]|nr:energy coupling factor transporter S component ThiW [Oscillospiraceae bacterium]